MIPFFVGYAVLMCLAAFRGRRRLNGLLTVVVGTLGLLLLAAGYLFVADRMKLEGARAIAGIIYYPYILAVVAISTWFVLLPRVSKNEGKCRKCGYDISSLSGRTDRCPECGFKPNVNKHSSSAIAEYQRRKWGSAPEQAPDAAGDQHNNRQPEDQAPPQPGER